MVRAWIWEIFFEKRVCGQGTKLANFYPFSMVP